MKIAAGKSLLLLWAIAMQCSCVAQAELGSTNKKAIKLYEQGKELYITSDYEGAVAKLKAALALDPAFPEANIYMGELLYTTLELDSAEAYYRKGLEYDSVKYAKVFNILGALHTLDMQYRKAVRAYQSYIDNKENLKEYTKSEVEKEMARLTALIPIVENPVPFVPENLGSGVNTAMDEYHPAITTDGSLLLFTGMVKVDPATSPFGNSREEEFFISHPTETGWGSRSNIGPPINSDYNEGAGCLSPDGNRLFFAAIDRNPDVPQPSMDIYMAVKKGNVWETPVNLGYPVCTGYFDSQPSFSSDGKTLYFTSKRPDGYGSSDLYTSTLNDDGTWTEPVNLGPTINTSGEEISPFIHPDGQTLYFASSGHTTLGGTDFFIARRNALGEFEKPVNIGYPINSTGQERSLIISADGTIAYYASDMPGGYGGFDLYKFELYEGARPEVVTYVKGKTYDSQTNAPVVALFELIDIATGNIVVEAFSDKVTGEFLLSLPSGKEYALNVSKEGYAFHSEHFVLTETHTSLEPLQVDIPLTPYKEGVGFVLRNVFFDTDEYELKTESNIELDRLVKILQDNPNMKIEIGGHTDNQGTKQHNQVLSENRAKAVYNYLTGKGISSSRLSYKGYGDTVPVEDNSTEKGRALNRRTEIKIISIK